MQEEANEKSDSKPKEVDAKEANGTEETASKTKLIAHRSPIFVYPGETISFCIGVCNYDGNVNIFESGRSFSCAFQPYKAPAEDEGKAKEKSEAEEETEKFGFKIPEGGNVEDLPKELKDAMQSSDDEKEGLSSVVPGPVFLKAGSVVTVATIPKEEEKDEEEETKKKGRRRRKKTEEDAEKSPVTIPMFASLAVKQAAGCAWLRNFAFHEDLAIGTELEFVCSETTHGMESNLLVDKGRKLTTRFSIVSKEAKVAAAKKAGGGKGSKKKK